MDAEILIVAAGRGARVGGTVPKQYRDLRGSPVLRRTISSCLACDGIKSVRVVIHPDDEARYTAAIASLSDPRLAPAVFGGRTRSESVRNGLGVCQCSIVLIHDGARPLVNPADIERILASLQTSQAAFLAVPVVDALWQIRDGHVDSAYPPAKAGTLAWRAQTPQGFRLKDIRAAHNATDADFADDVATARAYGITVAVIEGSQSNIKITYEADLKLAEKLIGRGMDIRTGNGFDVHKFGPGDHVTLNGIPIPFDLALVGHSDADVAMHALTDAIFGALAEGDIGHWFPAHDARWKDASSAIFLSKAMERAAERGFEIMHLDCTLICEMPKIGPHAGAMREKLSQITGVPMERISVKATTTEKLGFIGRGDGIAAQATATLVQS